MSLSPSASKVMYQISTVHFQKRLWYIIVMSSFFQVLFVDLIHPQASMGYIPGKGIGKDGTGIAEPISESANKGRRGLGYILEGLEKEDVKWEFEEVRYTHSLNSPQQRLYNSLLEIMI